ncbi:MAG: asparagine synthetase B [Chloroflexi bacterium]|nr:asparagine synthetase B [Chloroflexota bacterium]
MPGIVGFYGAPPAAGGAEFLHKMARALEAEDEFQVWAYAQPEAGMARVSLGIVNGEAQPAWDEQRQVGVVMEGELYDTARLRSTLAGRGHRFNTQGDAELILRLYLEAGEIFPAQLNGAFIAAIFDKRLNKLLIANDRLGLYPLFYCRVGGRFLFASGVRALLADPELPRKVDGVGMAQFLTLDHALGERTFLEAARLMPQGSVLTVGEDEFCIHPYSSLKYPKIYPMRDEEEYIEELTRLLHLAVHRQAQDDLPKAVLLSGGLDSRVIAALLDLEKASWPYYSFTWGVKGSDDVRYAAEVASKIRSQHHFFPLKDDYMRHTAAEAVRITDGLGNVVNMHALATLDEQVKYARVIYKGFLGDAMFGYALRQQHWADYETDIAMRAHLRVHQDQGVITFHPDMHSQLFNAEFGRKLGSAVMDTYRDGMLASDSTQLADQRLYFDLTQRVPRMTLRGVDVARSKAHVRLPFADNDLLDFAIHIPPGLRHQRRLVQTVFLRAFPDMARIPISWTGLPMSENFRQLRMRFQKLVHWQLYKRGLVKEDYQIWRPYHDYANWFRGTLRSWVADLLVSERSLSRGYYQPEFIRKMWDAHLAGEDHTVQIGALMTIELWHRQFID